jgi:hypothetical protein
MSVGSILNEFIHWASGEQNIILFNEFNKCSNKPTRMSYSINHIPKFKKCLKCERNKNFLLSSV